MPIYSWLSVRQPSLLVTFFQCLFYQLFALPVLHQHLLSRTHNIIIRLLQLPLNSFPRLFFLYFQCILYTKVRKKRKEKSFSSYNSCSKLLSSSISYSLYKLISNLVYSISLATQTTQTVFPMSFPEFHAWSQPQTFDSCSFVLLKSYPPTKIQTKFCFLHWTLLNRIRS